MSLLKKIKDKVAYEKESYRLAGEQLKKVAEELPYPPGYWHMTDAEIAAWRKKQKR